MLAIVFVICFQKLIYSCCLIICVHFLDSGQRGKIFNKHFGKKEDLGNFLQSHDNLRWLHYVQEDDYESAFATLKHLALKETQFLNRKKVEIYPFFNIL